MNKEKILFCCLMIFFPSSSFIIFDKNTKYYQNSQINIQGKLNITQNASFEKQVNFNGPLSIEPTIFQGNIQFDGQIYFNSNSISIGNDASNTVMKINNLAPSTESTLYYLAIDLTNENLVFFPLTQKMLPGANGTFSVHALNVNTLNTNVIQSQILTPNQNVIIIGNGTFNTTFQGNTLFLNARNDISSTQDTITINANITGTNLELNATGNTINSIIINNNITAINPIILNAPVNQYFLIEENLNIQNNDSNNTSFNANSIQFQNATPEEITINLSTNGKGNTLRLPNTPLNNNNEKFILIDSNNNNISYTLISPIFNTLNTNTISTNNQSSLLFDNIVKIGNSSSKITFVGTQIILPHYLVDGGDVTKNNSLSTPEKMLTVERMNKLLNAEIIEMLKLFIKNKRTLEKAPHIKKELQKLINEIEL